ncbi:MAG: RdgB/HAM1 family non-canonical purine NTP pyrophosphatase [Succinivibrionaceae bacterium]
MNTQKIVLATSNPGKAKEFNRMLINSNIEIVLQSEFNTPVADEIGTTFVENAIIKARNACKYSKLPAIADDSGIEVDCLNGAPGVHSARYSGENATDENNLNKLLNEVKKYPPNQRTARYWCVLVLMRHENDPTPIICQKSWNGEIILEKRGNNGFGYDPSFFIPILGKTAAELEPDVKNRISHRGQALRELMETILNLYGNQFE